MFLWRIAGHSLTTDLPLFSSPFGVRAAEMEFLILPGKLDRFRHLAEAESRESSSFFYKSCFFSVSLQLCTRPTDSAALALRDDRVPAAPRGPNPDTWQPFSALHPEKVPLVDASGWNSRWPLFQSEPSQRRPLAPACKQGKGKPWEGSCVHDLAQLSHHCLHGSPSFAF